MDHLTADVFPPSFVTNCPNANTMSHTLNLPLQLNTDPLSFIWSNNTVMALKCVCTEKQRGVQIAGVNRPLLI